MSTAARKPLRSCSVYLSEGWYYVISHVLSSGPMRVGVGEPRRLEQQSSDQIVGQAVLDSLDDFRASPARTHQEITAEDGDGAHTRLLKLAGHRSDVSFRRVTKCVMVEEHHDGEIRLGCMVTRTNRMGTFEGIKDAALFVPADPSSVGSGLGEAFELSWIQEHLG